MHVIYVLRDPRDKRIRYVGVTCQLVKKRLASHINDAKFNRNKCHRTNWINSVVRDGRTPTLEIIEEVAAPHTWQDRERYWIAEYRRLGFDLCNQSSGGEGSPGVLKSAETRAKLSAASKGRMQSPETKARRSASCKGRKVSPVILKKIRETVANRSPERRAEIAAKMAAARVGMKHSMASRQKMRKSHLGILRGKHSEETRAKIGAGNKGRRMSAEQRAKLSMAITKRMADPDIRRQISEKLKGRKVPREVVAKRAASQIGLKRSAETKARISAGHRRRLEKLKNEGI